MTLRPRPLHLPGRRRPLGVADLTFLPALPRVVCRNVKSKSHTRIIWLLVSLWFRRLYESVLQNDTNVGTGTLAFQAVQAGVALHQPAAFHRDRAVGGCVGA